MKTVSLIQGTPEWHAHRANHFNASDAPAMMGCSPYKTRSQLVRELATGALAEHDAATLRRFADGHRFEDLARPLAEQIIGEELYPVVGVDGPYSASYDGLTLLGNVAFEHKSLNDTLRASMIEGCTGKDLPELYQVQMEHQLLVNEDTDRVLFMASKWSDDELVEERHCWYVPNPELRAKIVAGWAQLKADVAAFEPAAPAAPATAGRAPDQMPALRIEVTGMVTASNLADWKNQAIAVFQGINQELVTDQDFADAEKTVKWCGDIEDQLKGAKQHALSQTDSIELLFRTIDEISEQARTTRLALDKLVTKRKEERRTEIGNNARLAVQDHILAINESLGEHGLLMPATLTAEIAAAMKGKRSISSMQEAVDTVAANAKITASQAADRVRGNIAILAEHADHATLFADRVQLCASKAPDDLRNLVAARIDDHQRAEKAKQDAAAAAEAVQAAQPVVAPVVRTVASTPAPAASAPVDSDQAPWAGGTLRLGEINSLIAPLTVSADGLKQLGFEPVGTERSAKLYAAKQFPAMCERMTTVLREAAAGTRALAA